MDTLANVYVTPSNLPPAMPSTRGDILRCAFDSTLPLTTVASEVLAKGVMTTMLTSVSIYRVEFRTTRGDGSDGASSARVYLPTTSAKLPLPVITIGHPTDGIAQSCAPSTDLTSNEDLALPWAGLGYVVIVPDYAGLGNGGIQSYLDNHDQAYSVLDGARALRKLLPAGALSDSVLAVGWSQGGGAVLSAQALAKSYGSGGTLAGVIAFAPEWPSRLNSFGFVSELQNPTELTIATGISEDVVTVMGMYAYFYNRVGPTHADDGFPAAKRAQIDSAVTTLCQTPLGLNLQINEPLVGDLFDPTFNATMLACIDGGLDGGVADGGGDAGDAGPGCVDPGRSYYEFLQQNILTADPNGPPMLYVQGLADVIMPPASEAACNLVKLAKDGVTPQVCVDAQALHTNVVGRNMDFALSWAFALLGNEALPTSCPSTGLPACTP
jgi:dienelactone hydrolase